MRWLPLTHCTNGETESLWRHYLSRFMHLGKSPSKSHTNIFLNLKLYGGCHIHLPLEREMTPDSAPDEGKFTWAPILEQWDWWAEKQGRNSVTRPGTILWAALEEAGKCSGRSNVRGRSADLKPEILTIFEYNMGLACKNPSKANKLETEVL